MASIPAGALILDSDEAMAYFRQWSIADRQLARMWIEKTCVTMFYVPPSGGYVAAHGGPNRSLWLDIPVNGLVMHAGFLHAWPNDHEISEDVRIPLSNYRSSNGGGVGSMRGTGAEDEGVHCPQCYLISPPTVGECDSCGYDLA